MIIYIIRSWCCCYAVGYVASVSRRHFTGNDAIVVDVERESVYPFGLLVATAHTNRWVQTPHQHVFFLQWYGGIVTPPVLISTIYTHMNCMAYEFEYMFEHSFQAYETLAFWLSHFGCSVHCEHIKCEDGAAASHNFYSAAKYSKSIWLKNYHQIVDSGVLFFFLVACIENKGENIKSAGTMRWRIEIRKIWNDEKPLWSGPRSKIFGNKIINSEICAGKQRSDLYTFHRKSVECVFIVLSTSYRDDGPIHIHMRLTVVIGYVLASSSLCSW